MWPPAEGNESMRSVPRRSRWQALDSLGRSGAYARIFIILLFLSLCILPVHATAPLKPEKFVYDLKWTGIKAGTASLQLKDEGNSLRILSTAQSAPWVSVFYTVDDRVESVLMKDGQNLSFLPSRYCVKIREGRHRRDKEVIFDYNTERAIYTDRLNNERREIPISPPVFDPLSGFFYLRTRNLTVGVPIYITVFDSKKVWNVEVQVLRREKIMTQSGTFDTIVIKPLMKSEGIFSRQGDVVIWLTDDDRRIPVKMQTKVAIGSVTAILVQGIT